MFTKINPTHISSFQNIVGKECVLFDKESLDKYSSDGTEDLKFLPEVVVNPTTPEQISQIVKICNKE